MQTKTKKVSREQKQQQVRERVMEALRKPGAFLTEMPMSGHEEFAVYDKTSEDVGWDGKMAISDEILYQLKGEVLIVPVQIPDNGLYPNGVPVRNGMGRTAYIAADQVLQRIVEQFKKSAKHVRPMLRKLSSDDRMKLAAYLQSLVTDSLRKPALDEVVVVVEGENYSAIFCNDPNLEVDRGTIMRNQVPLGVTVERVPEGTMQECGSCGCYHRKGYSGDCRNDQERFVDNT